jgi:hypothetical protein
MTAFGLLISRRCCALRLKLKARLNYFLSVSLPKGIYCLAVPFFHNCLLLVLAGMHPV